MKRIIFLSLLISQSVYASKKWISFDKEVMDSLIKEDKTTDLKLKKYRPVDGIYYTQIDKENLPVLSHFIKNKLKRHGGFIQHSSKPFPRKVRKNQKSWRELPINYSINKKDEVRESMKLLSEANISNDIVHLSSYHTRYHASKEAIEVMSWIHKRWSDLTAHRNDVTIEYFKHEESPQPTVILTIKGESDNRIIIGGHADSINTDDEGIHSRSPGANDNAAGIGVINDLIRVLMNTNFKPKRTIQFMAYAAEEVGILGSYEIAKEYVKREIKVDGVLNIDGVNIKGTSYDMAIIEDSSSKKQNSFIAMLLDEYIKVNWTYIPCGYGCSDHAAWNYEGYHASYPIDAIPSEQSEYEHTAEDTYDKSNNNATHALMFAKIGLAYIIELDNL